VITAILVPIVILAVLGFLAFAFFQRGREGIDLTPRGLLRLYLYIASLAAVLVFAAGLASVTNAAIATVFGAELVYGGSQVGPVMARPQCPPGAVGCVEPTQEQIAQQLAQQQRQEQEQRERRRAEDLIRGITFAAFGAIFWLAHWAARRGIIGPEERGSPLWRAYLMLGTAIFGLTTVIALPTGVYQALAGALLPLTEFGSYRQGADSLGLGLVALVAWLIYLRLAVRELRPAAA
jgi:hypothetical protein